MVCSNPGWLDASKQAGPPQQLGFHLHFRPYPLLVDLPSGCGIVCGTLQPCGRRVWGRSPAPRSRGGGAAGCGPVPHRQRPVGAQPLSRSGRQLRRTPAHLPAFARGGHPSRSPATCLLLPNAPHLCFAWCYLCAAQRGSFLMMLQVEGAGPPISVCTGAEWHRFPSAFFLPGERYRLQVRCAAATSDLHAQVQCSQWGGVRQRELGLAAACCSYCLHPGFHRRSSAVHQVWV